MSSRDPLWFCHECHSEMRPLMVPDPVCASCHGSFVEKMENPSDDPREYTHDGEDLDPGLITPGMDNFLLSLQSLMDRGIGQPTNTTRASTGPSVTFEVRGPGGARTVRLGGSNNTLGGGNRPDSPGSVPNMSTFLGPGLFPPPSPNGPNRPGIQGPLLAQYLMALLGHNDPTGGGLFGAMPESGRMGDYVFNQEALDQIITQIMENSNAHRPVPATEEIVAKLPREVLMEGSATLQLDCAVCKEQFSLATEDPDEQVVITLPCTHPFHEPCILPWLKSSGTCPVCRHALVPQPERHPTPSSPRRSSGGSPPRSNSTPGPSGQSRSPGRGHETGGGLFQSLFSGLTGHSHRTAGSNSPGNRPSSPPSSPHHRRSNSDPQSGRRGNNRRNPGNERNVPGSWSEDLD